MNLAWSPLGIERVTEAARRIAGKDPGSAERWVERIFASVERLSEYPRSGRVVPELGREDVREVIHEAYRVVYRISEDAILILTARHSRRIFDPDEVAGDEE